MLLGLGEMNFAMAEVEKEDLNAPNAENMSKTAPGFDRAVQRLTASIARIQGIYKSAPGTLQEEIVVTTFHLQNLVDSLKAFADTARTGKFPEARACAVSTTALQAVYDRMTRNALVKR